jgi:hypothetical protein
MHRVRATLPLCTNGGHRAAHERFAPLPLARAPMTCTGQGAWNLLPPPLWPAPVHARTGASRLLPDGAREQVCVARRPLPHFRRGHRDGLPRGRRGTPFLAPPTSPPLHATRWGRYRGGRGMQKAVCMPPPPLAAWPLPVCPPLAPPSSPSVRGVRATLALCANRECRAARERYASPPLLPLV